MTRPGPIPDSYWLIDGMLLAGEYPATDREDATRAKLAKFLNPPSLSERPSYGEASAGIRTFIDLTEEREPLTKYDRLLRELSDERKIETRHIRISVRDGCIPNERAEMERILATIREEVGAGRPVYVHCWGGIGRTGTVIGCWLVEQGLAGDEAIAHIAELRRHTPDGHMPSPENEDQRRYICEWRKPR
jgi:protein tyrosine/serine phosphatase